MKRMNQPHRKVRRRAAAEERAKERKLEMAKLAKLEAEYLSQRLAAAGIVEKPV